MGAILALSQLLAVANTAISTAAAVSDLIAKAKAEGRDVSKAELDALFANDDAARALLATAIADAEKGAG